MKSICPEEYCTACMVCASICSHNAINIMEDNIGFRRPYIDEDKCIACGLCKKVCPELNRLEKKFPSSCLAAVTANAEKRDKSSSGGVASLLAQHVQSSGGYVIACSGEDITNVRHRLFSPSDSVTPIAGSRYVQSFVSPELLRNVRQLINTGKIVLFIGTGCQTAGVKRLFKEQPSNLILVDLVCHGVASQKMLNETIDYYKHLYPGLISQSIHFREKTSEKISYGWYMTVVQKGNEHKVIIDWRKDPYMAAFLDHLSLRPCCFSCRYAFSARATDITLSDFWGLGKDSRFASIVGPSSVLINTDKGAELISTLEDIETEHREVGEAVKGVGRLQTPSPHNNQTSKFISLFKEIGFVEAVRRTTLRKFAENEFRNKSVIHRLIFPYVKKLKFVGF